MEVDEEGGREAAAAAAAVGGRPSVKAAPAGHAQEGEEEGGQGDEEMRDAQDLPTPTGEEGEEGEAGGRGCWNAAGLAPLQTQLLVGPGGRRRLLSRLEKQAATAAEAAAEAAAQVPPAVAVAVAAVASVADSEVEAAAAGAVAVAAEAPPDLALLLDESQEGGAAAALGGEPGALREGDTEAAAVAAEAECGARGEMGTGGHGSTPPAATLLTPSVFSQGGASMEEDQGMPGEEADEGGPGGTGTSHRTAAASDGGYATAQEEEEEEEEVPPLDITGTRDADMEGVEEQSAVETAASAEEEQRGAEAEEAEESEYESDAEGPVDAWHPASVVVVQGSARNPQACAAFEAGTEVEVVAGRVGDRHWLSWAVGCTVMQGLPLPQAASTSSASAAADSGGEGSSSSIQREERALRRAGGRPMCRVKASKAEVGDDFDIQDVSLCVSALVDTEYECLSHCQLCIAPH